MMKYKMVYPTVRGIISDFALYLSLREDNFSSRRFLWFFRGVVV